MNKAITSLALLLCLSVTACDKAPNSSTGGSGGANSGQSGGTSSSLKTYRFASDADQCDTYKRSFRTQQELCYSIQVDELNNDNCAETERKAYFDTNCKSFTTWNKDQAIARLMHTNGKFVDCDLTEAGLPTIRQLSSEKDMFMEHTASRAVVTHSLLDGRISIRMQLFDLASNKLIGQIQKVFQDETEPVSLSPSGAVGSPVLTCLVTVASNPNRE